MREAHQPPTTSPAGPPHDHTPGSSSLLPPSAKSDRIQQNPAETRVRAYPNSRAPARTRNSRPIVAALGEQNRAPSHVVHSPSHVIPAKAGISPRVRPAPIPIPAQTHRTDRTVFDKTEPAYYSEPMTTPSKPQPKEIPPCAKHTNPQPHRPPALRMTTLPDRRRSSLRLQNPTESNKIRQKLVCARTLIRVRPRARGTRVLLLRH